MCFSARVGDGGVARRIVPTAARAVAFYISKKH
jgi:hypothetical protein